jgi:hypothetical protein
VRSDVTGKNLRSGEFLVTMVALVSVLVIEFDVTISNPIGGKFLWTVLALKNLFVVGWMFLKPVLLKSISPLKRLRLVLAVFVHAKESSVLLLDQIVDLGGREGLLVSFTLVRHHFAVHVFLHLVLILVLVQRHFEPEAFATVVTLVLLLYGMIAVGVLKQSTSCDKGRFTLQKRGGYHFRLFSAKNHNNKAKAILQQQ